LAIRLNLFETHQIGFVGQLGGFGYLAAGLCHGCLECTNTSHIRHNDFPIFGVVKRCKVAYPILTNPTLR